MISSTPSDVMKEAVRLGMSEGAADFISLYERARFGGRGMNDEEKKGTGLCFNQFCAGLILSSLMSGFRLLTCSGP